MRIFIVWPEVKSPVLTVEGPKERHLQFGVCFLVVDFGLTCGGSVLAVRFPAAIDDLHLSVRLQGICSSN
jgi:hypothetical protein